MNGSFSDPGKLTPAALEVLTRRYLHKNKDGEIDETPYGLFRRVAKAVAEAEYKHGGDDARVSYWEDEFLGMMWDLDFLPNSPTLMSSGTGVGSLSACYCLTVEDSMEGIMQAATDQAMIEKYGGGVGFSLSSLRPKGSTIRSTQGKSCGPLGVLKVLSSVGTMITQGGKRDGAHLAAMSVYHPDILEFISCKQEEGVLSNFNISVAADANFMRAVEEDKFIHLTWPIDTNIYHVHSTYEYPVMVADSDEHLIINNEYKSYAEIWKEFVKARDIFYKIVKGAWENGEPGMIWLDRINEDNTTPHLGEIVGCNPCGEAPLLDRESCNLGSINLGNFVTNSDGVPAFDEDRFVKTVHKAVRFLDNIIDINTHPTIPIAEFNGRTRKIGLGVMGWADLLIRLGMPYDSEKAFDFADYVASRLREEADYMSSKLGLERGDFPEFNESPLNVVNEGAYEHMRNAWRTSIAPTGSLAMIADCSGGIEPHFSLAYKKRNMTAAMEGVEFLYVNKDLRALVENRVDDLDKWLGDDHALKSLMSEEEERLFRTSTEINPKSHVRMQAAWQPHIDSGISKTVNLPESATQKDVKEIYMEAWASRCKGVTTYRTGSREREVLVSLDKPEPTIRPTSVRPLSMSGHTDRVRTGHGTMYVTMNFTTEGRPFEVFCTLGKAGGCESSQLDAIARLTSLALRSDIDPSEVVDQLKGITCCPMWDDGTLLRSPADGMAHVLAKAFSLPPKEESPPTESYSTFNTKPCPDCGAPLEFAEGCSKCSSCGFSRCGG